MTLYSAPLNLCLLLEIFAEMCNNVNYMCLMNVVLLIKSDIWVPININREHHTKVSDMDKAECTLCSLFNVTMVSTKKLNYEFY